MASLSVMAVSPVCQGLAVILLFMTVVCAMVALAPAPPLASFYPSSTAIYASHGELLRLTVAKDQQYRLWLPLKEIPENIKKATLLYEDRYFYRHPGLNPWALLRSAWMTYVQGAHQGASTISMQVARKLYRIDSRSLIGKLRQVAAALWLELCYSKDEILEAYLNIAPYGGNISGVQAASLIYFHKPAAKLTLVEALTLAVIPQNPIRRLPERGLSPALLSARQRLWQAWLADNPDDQRYAADFELPLTVYARKDKPFIAPHLTDLLLHTYPNEHSIKSSIQLNAQKAIKAQLDTFMTQNHAEGIANAAVLLLNTDTMQVNALIGSANFWDTRIKGQVNGVLAKRSPGSTLKPFIYALALDQGLLHSGSILIDAPTNFGSFAPENFDGQFWGPVAVQEALIHSRNIPALTVAAKLKKPSLYEFLQQAGIQGLAGQPHYGLSLALGGGEVSMEELAQLYAMLVNRGEIRPLHYRADGKETDQNRASLLSSASAFITLDMLTHTVRPDSKRAAEPKVAWKTGTSWGFKDAWVVGVVGHYVLVVWVGNFDNKGNTSFIGIQTAAPLFFSVVDSLRTQRLLSGLEADISVVKPDNVKQIDVCAASGDLPNQDCPSLAKAWFIPGKSPIKTSTLHKAVYFDSQTGQVVCKNTPKARKEIYEFWSSDLMKLFIEAGLPRRPPPELPGCYDTLTGAGDSPEIVSPTLDSVYTLRLSKPSSIGLRANSASGKAIFWFANKSFLGKSAASESFSWSPGNAGAYLIRAVDALGHAATRKMTVEFVP